jgi:hypothetical protein
MAPQEGMPLIADRNFDLGYDQAVAEVISALKDWGLVDEVKRLKKMFPQSEWTKKESAKRRSSQHKSEGQEE